MSAVAAERPKTEQPPQLRVQYRDVGELIPYARNARKHTPEQVAQLMSSILEWGWTNPVLADESGIVAGHGRVMAAARLYEQGKPIRLPSGQQVPSNMVPTIDCSGWSAAQRQAYVIADNKLALNADWDAALLRVELLDLQEAGFGADVIGFTADELSVALRGWESDIDVVARDGENMSAIDAVLKLYVGKDEEEQARSVVKAALDDAGIRYELK
jgi:hypothetical protein